MAAQKPAPGAPPLAALETLFGPQSAPQDKSEVDAESDKPQVVGVPELAASNERPEPERRSSQRVWDTVRQADRAQRAEGRVTVTISVTASQRRKLKQMALDQDTTIQQLLEPSVLAVLRKTDRS